MFVVVFLPFSITLPSCTWKDMALPPPHPFSPPHPPFNMVFLLTAPCWSAKNLQETLAFPFTWWNCPIKPKSFVQNVYLIFVCKYKYFLFNTFFLTLTFQDLVLRSQISWYLQSVIVIGYVAALWLFASPFSSDIMAPYVICYFLSSEALPLFALDWNILFLSFTPPCSLRGTAPRQK